MFPEAGGSSLFVRRAFNELWSFFTAWAQMLNYVITIAISAFFAAGYFGGVARRPVRRRPRAASALGIALIVVLALVNVRGVKDAVAVNVVLAVVDFLSQLTLVVAGVFLVLDPDVLRAQPVVLRHRADLAGLPDRDPGRHRRLHGHRDDLEHGGGGARRGAHDPGRDQARDDRRVHDLLHAAVDRALGAAGALRRGGRVHDAARRRQGGRRLRRQPDARHRAARWTSGRSQAARRALRRHPRGDDPRGGDERGRARRLAARLLDGHAPADARRACGACTRASARPTSGSSSSRRSPASRCCPARPTSSARSTRSARCSRSRWRTSRCCGCASPSPTRERPYRSPGGVRDPRPRPAAARAAGLAGTGALAARRQRARPRRSPPRARSWLLLGMVVYVVYRRRQGLDLVSTHKVAIAEPVVDHEAEYDSVLVHVGDGVYDERLIATAAKLAAQRRRGIHVLVTITVPERAARSTRRCRRPRRRRTRSSSRRRLQGGRRVSGHWEKVRAGQAGRRIIEEAQDMRAAAVVLALPRADRGHVGVRQDARDGAGGAPVPRDHRVAARRPPARRADPS